MLKVRLAFKLRTSQSYLFFNVNTENTRIVYGSAERVGQIAPFDYYYLPKSIKQKSEPINSAYLMGKKLLLLSHHGHEKVCKIYLRAIEEEH